MRAGDPILIDTSAFVEGEADPQRFASLTDGLGDVATCDAAAGEFAIGLYAPRDPKTRRAAKEFFDSTILPMARLPHFEEDYREAARLVGEAIFNAKAKPSFPDGLIAACALRTDRTVWTVDETDFRAMGCKVFNPFSKHPSR
jgi:predicted nucleic acid-binding protein